MPPDEEDEDDLGGDPACWLSQVCDTCGRLVESDDHVCGTRAAEPPSG